MRFEFPSEKGIGYERKCVMNGGMHPEPLVSVVCTTFQHERFIRDALEGFLKQECPFAYEVIVGDDCSQDGTVEIVKEYVKRFPDIVKGVFHDKNQYSQGKSVTEPLIKMAKGKYIAICEGDDYWIDNGKLNKQIGYMQDNPGCTFCFSNARTLDIQTGRLSDKTMLPSTPMDKKILETNCELSVRDIMQLSFLPTASFVFRKDDWLKRPIFPKGTFMGDRYLQLVMTNFGYAHYIDEPMCVYRVNNPESMMGNWASNDVKAISATRGFINLYKEFNRYTQGAHSDLVSKLIDEREFTLYKLTGEYEALRQPKFRAYSKELGAKSQLAYRLRTTFPNVMRKLEGRNAISE